MDQEKTFQYWKEKLTIDWTPEIPTNYCSFSEEFAIFAEEVCTKAFERGTEVAINQAKILLSDAAIDILNRMPKQHRGPSANHQCLFPLFVSFYTRVRKMELVVRPPQLFEVVIPQPVAVIEEPKQPEFNGILLGEYLSEED